MHSRIYHTWANYLKSLQEMDNDHKGIAPWRRECLGEALVGFVACGLGTIFPPREVPPGLVLQKFLHSSEKLHSDGDHF